MTISKPQPKFKAKHQPKFKAKHAPSISKDGKKSGFRVAARAGQGQYMGRAKKIKESLIHKAKVKKDYFSMLKKEGIEHTPSVPQPVGEEDLPEIPRRTKLRPSTKVKTAPSRTQEEIDSKPFKSAQQIQDEKKAAAEQRKKAKSAFSPANSAASSSRRKAGQPDFKARMNVMLEKVKKQVSGLP